MHMVRTSFSTIVVASFSALVLVACSSSGSDDGDAAADTGRIPAQHRASATTCSPSTGTGPECPGGPSSACSTDADCTAGTNGHCESEGGGAVICSCFYDTCAQDSDCARAQGPCACQGSTYQRRANECAAGNCQTDADCGPNGYCSPSEDTSCSGGLAGYYCHTAHDECIDDLDCETEAGGDQVCAYSFDLAHWACAVPVLCP